jgi:pyruvate/2-oxoglutarate dehydrogenase complex dihydrolipoamide acyltransferase (E2) component
MNDVSDKKIISDLVCEINTPILNPLQLGILALHKIEDRSVAEKGQVVIHPMMYIALSCERVD